MPAEKVKYRIVKITPNDVVFQIESPKLAKMLEKMHVTAVDVHAEKGLITVDLAMKFI